VIAALALAAILGGLALAAAAMGAASGLRHTQFHV
jgi:hypothetical protein